MTAFVSILLALLASTSSFTLNPASSFPLATPAKSRRSAAKLRAQDDVTADVGKQSFEAF